MRYRRRCRPSSELASLREAGRLLLESVRYGNAYAVDRHEVARIIAAKQVPIVHMGNVPDIRRLVDGGLWLSVLLWIPREVCRQGSHGRGDIDTAARLRAWDETSADLAAHGEDLFSLRLDTDEASPDVLARSIAGAFDACQVSQ